MITEASLEQARNITRYYGRGFYRASFLFPREVRHATWVLYAFVRIPDEMVDTEKDREKGEADLAAWTLSWRALVEGKSSEAIHPILIAAKDVFTTYGIPYEYSYDFLAIMQQDFATDRYPDHPSLERYMYGSAAVVGLMMSHIIGFTGDALIHARALGESFQLINFIRDLADDYDTRGRIYFPQDEMDRFGITEEQIRQKRIDKQWVDFLEFQLARAEGLLRKGEKGIPLLKGRGRRAVYASALLYGELIEKIRKNNYDVFSKRATISPLRKSLLLLKSVWKRNL